MKCSTVFRSAADRQSNCTKEAVVLVDERPVCAECLPMSLAAIGFRKQIRALYADELHKANNEIMALRAEKELVRPELDMAVAAATLKALADLGVTVYGFNFGEHAAACHRIADTLVLDPEKDSDALTLHDLVLMKTIRKYALDLPKRS